MFGEDAVLQLVRVMDSAMARLADAIVSAFLVNVESQVQDQDPVGLGVARASAEAIALLPTVNGALDVLLLQPILAARRTILGGAGDIGYEIQPLCVGFVELVGSTALAQRLSTRELGSVLTEFEYVAADSVTAGGGRVVNLIGDEVLYTACDAKAACTIALNLAATFTDHTVVPTVRAGVAGGDVLLRDGDVFGPAVNLAARAVKIAAADEVVAPRAVAATAGIQAEPSPSTTSKASTTTSSSAGCPRHNRSRSDSQNPPPRGASTTGITTTRRPLRRRAGALLLLPHALARWRSASARLLRQRSSSVVAGHIIYPRIGESLQSNGHRCRDRTRPPDPGQAGVRLRPPNQLL